jgi:5-methylcytosine-specific restriction endonuclease McrA
MKLIYSFDSKRFHLGRLCKHGHRWPGTDLSLRRNHSITPDCMGCHGAKQRHWLLSFIDYEQMGWPANQTLGRLCQRGHAWQGQLFTLRINGRCQECERISMTSRNARRQERLKSSPEAQKQARAKARLWRQQKLQDPQWAARNREKQRLEAARYRAIHGRPSRAKSGEFATVLERREWLALSNAIRRAGRCPSVADLVIEAQRDYWRQFPSAYADHQRESKRQYAKWRHMTDRRYRIYHREKSRRRKAQAKGQTPVEIPANAIILKFAQFGNHCAYCGCGGHMEIEHVIPLSKGGAHDIGNIVPACTVCNRKKRANEMELWYRAQPFFSEVRLQAIRRATRPPVAVQLAFA